MAKNKAFRGIKFFVHFFEINSDRFCLLLPEDSREQSLDPFRIFWWGSSVHWFQIYMMFIIETRCSGSTCQWHIHNNYNFYQCHVFFSSTYALHRYYTVTLHFYSTYCKNSNCRMKKIFCWHIPQFFHRKKLVKSSVRDSH